MKDVISFCFCVSFSDNVPNCAVLKLSF